MRLRRSSLGPISFLVTLIPSTAAINLDCARARADGLTFDLSALGGPKTVIHTTGDVSPSYVETAFTIDICQPLKKTGPKGEDCPNGSRGMLHLIKFNPTPTNYCFGKAITDFAYQPSLWYCNTYQLCRT